MPRIFDNIERKLLPALEHTLELADHADFCVGYFNLRGWKEIDSYIENWDGGDGHCCRLLVGMQRLPQDELRAMLSLVKRDEEIDNQTAHRLRKKLAEEFREQLTIGAPTASDEAGLRRLASQIRSRKVVVKLFLRHTLHAKLYLLYRDDPINPTIGYLGSSNLTLAGLSAQGELNVDVLDDDACQKLSGWFEDRWSDKWCIDISDELATIIEESWAREKLIPPYHIYVKIAYHLSQEARAGLSEFRTPRDFAGKLLEFQEAAVRIAAHHLNKRGGVLIGDVVGLGKTLMATALARIFEDDLSLETLIICPKNLVKMWQDYREQYRMRARVLSLSQVLTELPKLRRFRVVLIDESHNLRNREGMRYRAIREYVQENESRCILLSATPYNKTYLDLSNQLRIFVPEDKDLGVRPEMKLREVGETEFVRQHQCSVRSLAAFEHSPHADDWREVMRLYMVRRTRSFIEDNYALTDPHNGRKYLLFPDGSRSEFPDRIPKTVKFAIDDANAEDQYARLYGTDVVDAINHLTLPRYGLGNYVLASPARPPTTYEANVIAELKRAGRRLVGFSRTNLFKRLESGGHAFLESIERHILRNYVFLHALESGIPLPIGPQDAALLDSGVTDEDERQSEATLDLFEDGDEADEPEAPMAPPRSEDEFVARAGEVYRQYAGALRRRFKWLSPELFDRRLAQDLLSDVEALRQVLADCGQWDPMRDAKLAALEELLGTTHKKEKVLIFTQFADTVRYVEGQLRKRGMERLAGATGASADPTGLAWRFSPDSNKKRNQIQPGEELRVLIATDVLSEGQNLQDAHVVVNYDLPWAIIRLIQRAGRVDRIGQQSQEILCYSFLPADGVERLIRLRARVRQRLHENAEVVGADEAFFEDDSDDQNVVDLYNEKAGILDADKDSEVDLASYAYQIWKNATTNDPALLRTIPALPPVAYSTRGHVPSAQEPNGVLTYLRTAEGTDALAWIGGDGRSVTESQFTILKAAECDADTPPLPRLEAHHELVQRGVALIVEEEGATGGQLGRPSGARFKTYERLKRYAEMVRTSMPMFESPELLKAIDDIYRYPLRSSATDSLNRQLKAGIADEALAQLVISLRDEGRLCIGEGERPPQEPRIICSMGLRNGAGD